MPNKKPGRKHSVQVSFDEWNAARVAELEAQVAELLPWAKDGLVAADGGLDGNIRNLLERIEDGAFGPAAGPQNAGLLDEHAQQLKDLRDWLAAALRERDAYREELDDLAGLLTAAAQSPTVRRARERRVGPTRAATYTDDATCERDYTAAAPAALMASLWTAAEDELAAVRPQLAATQRLYFTESVRADGWKARAKRFKKQRDKARGRRGRLHAATNLPESGDDSELNYDA